MKYRKKPVVIEAEQYHTGDTAHAGLCWCVPNRMLGAHLETLEGPTALRDLDWIITGIKGEHYPVRDDIFRATYEPV